MHEYWTIAGKLVAGGVIAAAVAWGTVTARLTGVEQGLGELNSKVEWIMRFLLTYQ